MDVVYRVRVGERNDALRFSLRSLRNVEHDAVWVVGHRPRWVTGVEHVPGQGGERDLRLRERDLARACRSMGAIDALLVDDDMYLLEPWRPRAMHRGPLADHAAQARGAYRRSLVATDEALRPLVDVPLSYELHVPFPFVPSVMAGLLQGASPGIQPRSLYGNVERIGGTLAPDVKVRRREDLDRVGPLLSTSSAASKFRLALPLLGRLFPDPSPYEARA